LGCRQKTLAGKALLNAHNGVSKKKIKYIVFGVDYLNVCDDGII
jgi:hypothetical protein